MLDHSGAVLYVGKAVNLKRRVKSYFQKSNLSPRIQLMVEQVESIETTITRTEVEALLLENNLIKSLSPRYNILFRDDKSYPYVMISGHAYPMLAYHRGSLKKHNQYFGPYPDSNAVRESIHILQKVFRLRSCEDSVFSNRSRPCLLYQIKRCSAPCVGKITEQDYMQSVQNAIVFLHGKQSILIDSLTKNMESASDNMDFERAAELRDQIQSLVKIQEKQFISHDEKQVNADVIAIAMLDNIICINVVMIRGGHHLGDKSFFPMNAEAQDIKECMEAFLAQHYLDNPLPDILIFNSTISLALQKTFQQQKKIKLVKNPNGTRKKWLEMAETNALAAIQQKQASSTTQQQRLQALNDILNLHGATRFECFDISHTQGEFPIASCVVYDQEMKPSEYRRFNIKQAKPGDDYAAMKEALFRRYEKIVAETGKLPNAIIIDGGKGQVSMAQQVMQEIGLTVPLVGVAKGESRKAGLETLIVPHLGKQIQLVPNHPALLLIQTIRDEAHRFAISGHRAKRGKARTVSILDTIPGIGPKRRKQLLNRFGSVRAIKYASVDDLLQVDGIHQALAEKIYNSFH